MVVLIEMIGNWVTRSAVANGCLMAVNSESELCTRFTYIIDLSLKHLLHVIKYTTLDELHENDPGLTIDVVPGRARDGLVSIKLHIWHFIASHLKFPCNVVVVLLTLLWIKVRIRLGGCLYAIIGGALKGFPADGVSTKLHHTFLCFG